RTPRPIPAAANARKVVGRSRGCTKPSVNKDEPLSLNAECQLETPSAWNIIMKPVSTIASQTAGCTSSVSGAYSAMTRSRPPYVLLSPAKTLNTRRVLSQMIRVSVTTDPRGSTSDRTAASSTTPTSPTPAANHATLTTTSIGALSPRGRDASAGA